MTIMIIVTQTIIEDLSGLYHTMIWARLDRIYDLLLNSDKLQGFFFKGEPTLEASKSAIFYFINRSYISKIYS